MRRVLVVESLTLDGVMQAPGAPDEDRRGGFEHGGWAQPYMDEVMGSEMAKGMGRTELLFGRRTYDQFYSFWPTAPQPNPFTEVLNTTQKYVVSSTLTEPLPWVNSTLLRGDAEVAVARLKEQPGKDLVILGSGELVRFLGRHGLIDEYTLLIHPLVLGSGHRLFPDGSSPAQLRLTNSVTTTTGVVIATYQPADAEGPPQPDSQKLGAMCAPPRQASGERLAASLQEGPLGRVLGAGDGRLVGLHRLPMLVPSRFLGEPNLAAHIRLNANDAN